jgi:RNA polymerase sigma factor (sigma-70 family)
MESYLMKEATPDLATAERWLRLRHEAQAGNPEAEVALLAEVRPFLKRCVQKQMQGQAFGAWDASDVVQACSLKILLPGPEMHGTTGREFLAWLETIARNEFLSTLRAGKTQKRGGGHKITPLPGGSSGGDLLAGDTSTPSQQLMRQEEQDQQEAALRRLPPDHQQVIRLRCSPEQLSWAQIAQQMNRTEDAVKKLFWRACKRWSKEKTDQP